jgi:hypothetical protein
MNGVALKKKKKKKKGGGRQPKESRPFHATRRKTSQSRVITRRRDREDANGGRQRTIASLVDRLIITALTGVPGR